MTQTDDPHRRARRRPRRSASCAPFDAPRQLVFDAHTTAGAAAALARPGRLAADGVRDRPARRRRPPLRDARARRRRDGDARRLPRGRPAVAHRHHRARSTTTGPAARRSNTTIFDEVAGVTTVTLTVELRVAARPATAPSPPAWSAAWPRAIDRLDDLLAAARWPRSPPATAGAPTASRRKVAPPSTRALGRPVAVRGVDGPRRRRPHRRHARRDAAPARPDRSARPRRSTDDPLGAFRAARADVEALLADPAVAARRVRHADGAG